MVRALIDGKIGKLEQGCWTGLAYPLSGRLAALTEQAISQIWGDNPTPELAVAEIVVKQLDGRIVESEPEPDTTVGRIY